ncbi:MAG: phenylalanine--tRNA ligase subunit alpha [Candidatus Poribacteria bacterium]|nr:phenylalanine--tRNA ligase subunit alpha [Candidatus Poribacteria bacterium]MDE0506845.1 phenylalanine--tRNA ligase subunit alpha [Candidatus Poribacteria bacterium]
MREELKRIEADALAELSAVTNSADLEELRIKFFGRKGLLSTVMRGMGTLTDAERPVIGKLANEVRQHLTNAFEEVGERLNRQDREKQLAAEAIDITLPGRRPQLGKKHPITQTIDHIQQIFGGMGFQVADGPEIEHEYYNFDALNTPVDHPARDLQDTLYITDEVLLRTHTSPVQVRFMEKHKPPIRIIVPGKAYRLDYDVSHTPTFHQVEGLLVDQHVTFSELKGVLQSFARQMFGDQTAMRFRPHFFPFTEPSAEVDISCTVCSGKGCRTCSGTGWLEILGAGAVDPNVFEYANYSPNEVTGFAFGMGVERIASISYGIPDIRALYENDLRFLRQF